MNKLTIVTSRSKISLVLIACLWFCSCKKDYTCPCTTSVGDVNKYEYKNVKRKNVEKDCKAAAKDYYSHIRQMQVTENCVLN